VGERENMASDPTRRSRTRDNGASRTPSVQIRLYRTSCGSYYRLAVVFTLPALVLLVWADAATEGAMVRLMTLYWKVGQRWLANGALLVDAGRGLRARRCWPSC